MIIGMGLDLRGDLWLEDSSIEYDGMGLDWINVGPLSCLVFQYSYAQTCRPYELSLSATLHLYSRCCLDSNVPQIWFYASVIGVPTLREHCYNC